MKILSLLILFLLLVTAASAQSGGGVDIKVIAKKWKMDIRVPIIEGDPNKAANDRVLEERQRVEIEKLNETLRDRNMPIRDQSRRPIRNLGKSESVSITYKYEVKIQNTGNRKIRGFIWEYVFIDRVTREEAGRRRFLSRQNIDPGKTKTITERSAVPPTGTVDATTAGKKEKDLFLEQILIKRVRYEDGTEWRAPVARTLR